MLIATLMLLLQASTPAAADIDEEGTITVTATRLSDLAAEVAACAATPCPTRRDVAVSVAYASALFNEGRYTDAKKVLGAAVARVKHAAAAEPLAVSQLYNAQASLSKHEGDQDITRRATHKSYLVLRDNLGATALPTLMAEYRVAKWQVRVGHYVEAETQFARLARSADTAGYRTLSDACELLRAQLLVLRKEDAAAFALIDAVADRNTSSAEDSEMRRAALATAVRLANDRRDKVRTQAYVERLMALGPGDEPLLLSDKPLPVPGRNGSADALTNRPNAANAGSVLLRWVDIGYWIRPDGSVDDVEVLRGSQTRGWETLLLRAIAGRRYVPTKGTFGHYRVERYTLTADYFTGAGTLIRRRGLNPRFEMTPMTPGDVTPS